MTQVMSETPLSFKSERPETVTDNPVVLPSAESNTHLRALDVTNPPRSGRRRDNLPPSRDSAYTGQTAVGLDAQNFDFEGTLRTVLQKRGDSDIKGRELGVVFEDLSVIGLGATAKYQPTLGSMFNPVRMLDAIQELRHPPVRNILTGFEGVVRPGEMLLVLGRPGAGCSTFLKTIANHTEEYHCISGSIHYDSFSPSDISSHYRGDVTYCPEDDIHFPTLTVEQTLKFAAKMRAPQARLDGMTRDEFVERLEGMLTTIFGLKHARGTVVGNAAIRGVSGGEKKRVSIAETLASRSLIGCWDNSTRGLDASTALEFMRTLRIATDIASLTTIVSIYQASESLYKLFDKVAVISEGRMIYFGPGAKAREYFEGMGYAPHDRQTTADFLVSVTDPNGRAFRRDFKGDDGDAGSAGGAEQHGQPGRGIPKTPDEMAQYFNASQYGVMNRKDIESYKAEHVGNDEKARAYKASARQERARNTSKKSPYTVSLFMQAKAVIARRVQITRGDLKTQGTQLFSFIFQGIIMGTVFFKSPTSTSAYFSRGGILFFVLLFNAISAMAEIPALFAQRPIVHRHQKAAMYHPFMEGIALTIVDIPITLMTQGTFCVIVYFMVKLQQTATQFSIFSLFVVIIRIAMIAFFRSVAAASKKQASAQSVAGLMVFAIVLYIGYMIPQPSMIGALRWITYINPVRYGFEGLIVNEFHTLNGTCANLVPSGEGYEGIQLANQVCSTVGSVPGLSTVDGNRFVKLSYDYEYAHLWRNFGVVVAFTILFIIVLLGLTEMNTTSDNEKSVILYKRGSKSTLPTSSTSSPSDPEKGDANVGAHSHSEDRDIEKTEVLASGKGDDDGGVRRMMSASANMTGVFSWRHIEYTVPVGGAEHHRKLLDDVSGYVTPGKLTALMGESGAGKTTLLNVLAERTGTGIVQGERYVNGHALPSDFQAQTGYCQQMDTHQPETTVREALLFSAKLRQHKDVPLEEKEAYVEKCLVMCGLEKQADAIVGSLGVEHRKRTTIGVELAAKPKLLLFLDEPTSGLDSQSAWAIMTFLRDLADSGQAILCTIHQPSGELFQLFDRLLLLRKGGQTVYFGDIGKRSSVLISYFEKHGATPCGPDDNTAEWMLDVIGAGATATSSTDWYDVWTKSEEAASVQREIDRIHDDGKKRPPVRAAQDSEFATPWGFQLRTLTQRAFSCYWRDPTYLFAKLILNVVAGLFIGFTFFKSKDTIQGTQNKLFAIFMSTIMAVPLSNQLQAVFIDYRDIYEIRERSSRMYSWSALITAQLLVELPWNWLGSSLFYFCWYWTVGFSSHRAGYTFLLYAVIFPIYYTTIAQATAAMAPNAVISAIVFTTLFSFVITFNGVLQPFSQLGWWKWMYRVSPFTYLIEGMLGQSIGKMEINCAQKEFVSITPPSGRSCADYMQQFIANSGGYLTNPDATSNCEFCPSRTTDEYFGRSFNIRYSHRWRNVGIVLAVTLFNVFALYALTYLFRVRQGSIFGSLKNKLRFRKSKQAK
ncbi:pleiotropic drug resistance ABC transporter [Rickenella mellea]|uniref:Pleiotropic drug resistance ABC transporter n=1 Tax=Rickenella mellea TaxID=50990 RepID=A0A4Y7PKX8_9AGAM|nr:pleiotropic drug resistance ABC transporter [Rickenella mellea]